MKYLTVQKVNHVVADLLQLPPIKAPHIFECYNNGLGGFFNLWLLFVMAEVMRQKGEGKFCKYS